MKDEINFIVKELISVGIAFCIVIGAIIGIILAIVVLVKGC